LSSKEIIVFKVPDFPRVSETFILNQILRAIDFGYDVRIMVRRLLESNSCNKEVVESHSYLFDKIVVEDFGVPKRKCKRLIVWLKLILLNLKHVFNIHLYYKQKERFSLTWLFEWNFFKQYENVKLFHVQYGTNQYPLTHLKAAGYKPKLICSFHGHDAFFPISGYIENNGYYNGLFQEFDKIISNTQYLGNQLLSLGCPVDKLLQIPVTVNTDKFKPLQISKKNLKFTLITVGRLHRSKGQIFLLKAIKEIIKEGLCIKLIVIGSGPELEELKSYTDSNELTRCVHFTGAKSAKEIIELLTKSHLFVFTPITLENGWAESQGLAISEAMACGLPVVAFDTGGVRYTFDYKSGYLVKEKDVEDLVQKIILLFRNRELLEEMSINSRDFVIRNYSNKVVEKKWEIIYAN